MSDSSLQLLVKSDSMLGWFSDLPFTEVWAPDMERLVRRNVVPCQVDVSFEGDQHPGRE